MTDETKTEQHAQDAQTQEEAGTIQEEEYVSIFIRFRPEQPSISAFTRIHNLKTGETVMVQTDHGLEPALVMGPGASTATEPNEQPKASCMVVRRASRDEEEKYASLIAREREAFSLCHQKIEKHQLVMKLIRVERYFNGSKIIFYFTAENRVDFRELVKDLVQEFRTRVEMRQIGVRHETKMIGGIGCCGRELCCASYLKSFAPVSIKMAKEQDLPLNPAKISGNCNRLLCCLTYEYDAYREIKKQMPRHGKQILLDGKNYKVIQLNALKQTVTILDPENPGEIRTLEREEWEQASFETPKKQPQKKKKPPKNSKK